MVVWYMTLAYEHSCTENSMDFTIFLILDLVITFKTSPFHWQQVLHCVSVSVELCGCHLALPKQSTRMCE